MFSQRYWNRRYNISIWMMKSNVFFKYFKYFKHSWAQKRNTSFRIPTETFNGDCVQRIIMYVVYSIPRRSSEWTVLDVWPACPLSLDVL
jgi:hypothetical protein